MAYTTDRRDHYCAKCRKKVTLVRCNKCNGKGAGLTTHCSYCNNTGYACQYGNGDKYHQW